MTDPASLLAGALPADPDDHGPIAVPSDAVRRVLGELMSYRRPQPNDNPLPPVTIAGPIIEQPPAEDGGA